MSENTPQERKNQTKPGGGISWVIVSAIIVIIAAGGIWYVKFANSARQTAGTETTTSSTAGNTSSDIPAIQNNSDLQAAGTDLDSSNMDTIDTTLSQNDVDSSLF